MGYKISVIIPCYNAEKTLERAVSSVINQTFSFEKNIELLLYNDASVDGTEKLIKAYSRKYENIIPIFGSENKGPGFGKNKCLERSTGEYILFLDADDEYDKDMCKKLYLEAKSENADLVVSGVLRYDNINVSKNRFGYDDTKAIINTEDKIVFTNKNIFYLNDELATHCLFKYEIIKKCNIMFLETYYAEDIYFRKMYTLHSKKAVYLKNYFGYIHHAYTNSITKNIDLSMLIKIHEVYLKILGELRQYDLDLVQIFNGHVIYSLDRLYALNIVKTSPKNEIISFLKEIRQFEIDIEINHLDVPFINVLNRLILQEKYTLAYVYLRLLGITYNSKKLRGIYRRSLNE